MLKKITGFKKEQNQVENPKQLAEIVRKSDPNTLDKTVLIDAFPRYLKTLPEQMNNLSFESYQKWANTGFSQKMKSNSGK